MSFFGKPSDSVGSFLPEDYLQKKAERRGVFIALFLFVCVALGVVGAFFVTNRQWQAVKQRQEEINRDYATETKKIDQLKQLEDQKADMLAKAEITTALIEKVPRSILMAELINRMPDDMTLTQFSLKSKRIVEAVPAAAPKSNLAGPSSLASKGKPAASAQTAPPPKPAPAKFDFKLEMTGLAATDDAIADYHAALTQCPLLHNVEMLSSTEVVVQEVPMRKFRIDASIKPTADARTIEPLMIKRGTSRADAVDKNNKSPGGLLGLFGSRPSPAILVDQMPKGKPGFDPMDPTVPLDPPTTNAEPKPE